MDKTIIKTYQTPELNWVCLVNMSHTSTVAFFGNDYKEAQDKMKQYMKAKDYDLKHFLWSTPKEYFG